MQAQTINWETFTERFCPVQNHIDDNAAFDGLMFETYGPEIEHVLQQPENLVWTILDTDEGTVIASGRHHVNRLGYILTAVPVPAGKHYEIPDDE